MKMFVATLAAAGIAAAFAVPAQAEATSTSQSANNKAQVEHTDVSAQRYYRRHYGYRYRPYGYGPRYGYYRPYYRPYYYGPGVGFGFWGGPRVGVWF
jgi:hypothetical protein